MTVYAAYGKYVACALAAGTVFSGFLQIIAARKQSIINNAPMIYMVTTVTTTTKAYLMNLSFVHSVDIIKNQKATVENQEDSCIFIATFPFCASMPR